VTSPAPAWLGGVAERGGSRQALTRWNDAPGRAGGGVLAVLDRAIARVIPSLAALPAPRVPAGAPS
jgi:hypothetical protein